MRLYEGISKVKRRRAFDDSSNCHLYDIIAWRMQHALYIYYIKLPSIRRADAMGKRWKLRCVRMRVGVDFCSKIDKPAYDPQHEPLDGEAFEAKKWSMRIS